MDSIKEAATTDAGPNEPHERDYDKVRNEIGSGDLLLFRGKSFLSRLILKLTGGGYSHVGVFYWWGGRLVVFQAAWNGVSVLPASSAVCRYNGQVDWWALDRARLAEPEFEEKLFDLALTRLGMRFGVWGMLKLGLRLLWGRVRHVQDLAVTNQSMFCSQFVSSCFRLAGIDLVPDRPDHWTSPADFARSGFFHRRFELYDASQGKACARIDANELFAGKRVTAPAAVAAAAPVVVAAQALESTVTPADPRLANVR